MWCTCGAVKANTVNLCDCGDHPDQYNWDYWVCAACNLPTRMVFEKMTGMMGPRGALALLHSKTGKDGVSELLWATTEGRKKTLTYKPYPTKVGPDKFMNSVHYEAAKHLNFIWNLLDDAYKEVLEPTRDADLLAYSKARCRTLCDVLAQLMAPFYESSDDVALEAGRRYRAAVANGGEPDPNYETPGLAESIFDPATRWDGTPMAADPDKRVKPLVSKIKNTKPMPPEAIPAAKQALALKMMTVSQIANMYGVSEETVFNAVGS